MYIFKRYLSPVVFLLLTTAAACSSYGNLLHKAQEAQAAFSFSVNQKVILIDAGHGGWGSCGYS